MIRKVLRFGRLSLLPLRPVVRRLMYPPDFLRTFYQGYQYLRKNPKSGITVFQQLRCDVGHHPQSYIDYECEFAAKHISRIKPASILDVGSYRRFVIGLLAGYSVTTIDVRERDSRLQNEKVVTCDAKKLDLPDKSFDMVISLFAIAHFGLGRYGDEIDFDADRKAIGEMIRVLKPGGSLLFTTIINRRHRAIAFNAHRIYDYAAIQELCGALSCEEESYFHRRLGQVCTREQITDIPKTWDVYCGCWKNT